MYIKFIKRILDIIIAISVIILFSPFFVIIYFFVKIESSGNFFFFQERLGYKSKIFEVYKIRTLYDKERVAEREIFKNDIEITKVGFILRRFKIDELPQIINVLKGDMSLVGPRPCLPKEQINFNEDGELRLNVRPGLTGLAQVNGNIYLTWEQRWKYDRIYVDNQSFLMDLKIVLRTILIIIFGEVKFIKNPNV